MYVAVGPGLLSFTDPQRAAVYNEIAYVRGRDLTVAYF